MQRRIHLIRHGLSEANLDSAISLGKPDHAIELSPTGHDQATSAGSRLSKIINGTEGFQRLKVRLLVSPYVRARQTADAIQYELERSGLECVRHESIQLREQSFGLFNGVPDERLREIHPIEHANHAKHVEYEGRFYAPIPMGESRAQVCDRVRASFASIHRDMNRKEDAITDTVIVSHGVTIRCFLTEWLHLPWEWCEREPNPWNCSINTLTGSSGRGWKHTVPFQGFEHPVHSEQDRREEGIIA